MLRHLTLSSPLLGDLREPDWWGYLYVVGIFVGQILGAFFYYHAAFTGWTLAAKIRAVMIMMTYKKSLKVQNTAARDSGRVVNMVSSDAQYAYHSLPPHRRVLTGELFALLDFQDSV
jgi:hypothetical protein